MWIYFLLSVFVSEKFESKLLFNFVNELFLNNRVDVCLTGWVDLLKEQFNALMMFVEPTGLAITEENAGIPLPFSEETMDDLYKKM